VKIKRKLPWALFALVLTLVLAAAAAGCGGDDEAETTPADTSAGTEPTAEAIQVGLVTDIGGLNDRGFNHLSYLGLQRAQGELGVQGRVFQAKSTQEYVPNLSTFARQGYDLTIGVGFTEANAIDTAATNFPSANFAIVDVDQSEEPHKPKNLLGLLFREQETGYLVGYLAGLEEKRRPGKDVIGSVGATLAAFLFGLFGGGAYLLSVLLAMLGALLITTYLPFLSTWIPKLLRLY